MANHCSNWIHVKGTKANIDAFIQKVEQAVSTDTKHLWYETFAQTLDLDPKGQYEFGTKWFDCIIERNTDEEMTLSGDSAWGPPTEWLLQISEKFSFEIESEYEECGNDFAGYYNCTNGEVTRDDTMGYFQYRLNEDRESAIENVTDCCETFEEFEEEMGSDIKLLTPEEIEEVKAQYEQETA